MRAFILLDGVLTELEPMEQWPDTWQVLVRSGFRDFDTRPVLRLQGNRYMSPGQVPVMIYALPVTPLTDVIDAMRKLEDA